MLKIEGVGHLKFRPNGRSIVLEYLPPYEERGQYGIERGGRILQLSLSSGRQATPLFEHQPGEKYWLGDASPDGRRLLVFQASRQRLQLGIYDFETKDLTFVDEVPQVNERFEMNSPIWINEREIVFLSGAENWSQYGIRERPYVTDRTSTLREKAFAGESSVVSSSTEPVNHWYDGYLSRYNVDTKRISSLAQGRFGSFTLSADGKRLAALRLGQRLVHFQVAQLTDFYRFETQLYVFDLENGSSRSFLPNMHVSMESLRWSDTRPTLSFFAWNRMTGMEEGTHYVMDSGSIIPIHIYGFAPSWISLAGFGTLKRPVAAEWLQRELIVHGVLDERSHHQEIERTHFVNVNTSEKANWYVIDIETMTAETLIDSRNLSHESYRLNDGRLLLQSDQALFVASDSTTPVSLDIETHNSIRVLNGSRGDEIADIVVFVRSAQGTHEVCFYDLKRNELLRTTLNLADRVIAWAPDQQQIVTRSDTQEGSTLTLRSATRAPSAVFTFNEHLSEIEHPRWETIEYRGDDGVETFSCILLPYNYDPQKSYPTIVDIYPGIGKGCLDGSRIRAQPLGRQVPFHNNNDLLSASGYLVVIPSNRYELNQANGTLYGGLEPQVDAALDALIAAGIADPERIGIWGFSNGSLASLWLASVSNRYKAVVPMFGASSPYFEYFGGASSPRFQMYLGTPIVHLVQYESEPGTMPLSMGRSAIAAPFAYIEASPLDRANHICSQVMMVHSDLDGFTQFHYEALFSAMYRLGKRAELVRYFGEGHGLRSPGNIRDFYKRVLAFFEEYVATGAPMTPCSIRTAH